MPQERTVLLSNCQPFITFFLWVQTKALAQFFSTSRCLKDKTCQTIFYFAQEKFILLLSCKSRCPNRIPGSWGVCICGSGAVRGLPGARWQYTVSCQSASERLRAGNKERKETYIKVWEGEEQMDTSRGGGVKVNTKIWWCTCDL